MTLSSTYQSTGLPLLSTLYEPPPKHLISVLGGRPAGARRGPPGATAVAGCRACHSAGAARTGPPPAAQTGRAASRAPRRWRHTAKPPPGADGAEQGAQSGATARCSAPRGAGSNAGGRRAQPVEGDAGACNASTATFLTRSAPPQSPLEGVGGERNQWHGRSRCLPLCPLGGGWWGHRSLCRSGSCVPTTGGRKQCLAAQPAAGAVPAATLHQLPH